MKFQLREGEREKIERAVDGRDGRRRRRALFSLSFQLTGSPRRPAWGPACPPSQPCPLEGGRGVGGRVGRGGGRGERVRAGRGQVLKESANWVWAGGADLDLHTSSASFLPCLRRGRAVPPSLFLYPPVRHLSFSSKQKDVSTAPPPPSPQKSRACTRTSLPFPSSLFSTSPLTTPPRPPPAGTSARPPPPWPPRRPAPARTGTPRTRWRSGRPAPARRRGPTPAGAADAPGGRTGG